MEPIGYEKLGPDFWLFAACCLACYAVLRGAWWALVLLLAEAADWLARRKRGEITAVSTTFHGLSNFRRYALGRLTFEQWKNSRHDIEVTEIPTRPKPTWRSRHILWGTAGEVQPWGHKQMVGKWYGIRIGNKWWACFVVKEVRDV